MPPTSNNKCRGHGRRARLLTTLGSTITVLGMMVTPVLLTGLAAQSSQDFRTLPAVTQEIQRLPGVTIFHGDTGPFPALPPMPKGIKQLSEKLLASYMFVAEHPEVTDYIPCFCPCAKDKIHKSLADCFVKRRGKKPENLEWTIHGGQCATCIVITVEVKSLHEAGKSVPEIRAVIDMKYAKAKLRTDTPMPPPHHH